MSGNRARPMVVQDRDLEFCRILGPDARLVDREQFMKFAGFKSQTRANERLLKLTANGFLRRYFLGTLKGGSKALYTLSPKGALAAGVKNRPVIRPKDMLLVGDPFVNHQLVINEVHIAARFASIENSEAVRFRSFPEPLTKAIPLIPPLGTREARLTMHT
jgi:protein involved in plasmid replication-relaxation